MDKTNDALTTEALPVIASVGEANFWFRRNGLPYFVRGFRRLTNLVPRTVPFLLFVAILVAEFVGITQFMVTRYPELLDETSTVTVNSPWLISTTSEEVNYLLSTLFSVLPIIAIVLIAAVPAWAINNLIWRYRAARLPVSIAVMAFILIVLPLWGKLAIGSLFWAVAAANALWILLALLFTATGVGSVVSWSFRQSLQEFKTMGLLMSRVLPVLMIVIIFAFFDPSFWQLTREITSFRLAFVGTVFLALGIGIVYPLGRRQLRSLMGEGQQEADAAHYVWTPLSRSERANLNGMFILAMLFQVLIFTFLTTVFLVILGEIAMTPELISRWSGSSVTSSRFLGLPLSVDPALLKTAVFLSFVSSLNFLVSVATNREYREAFYGPMMTRMRVALEIRRQWGKQA